MLLRVVNFLVLNIKNRLIILLGTTICSWRKILEHEATCCLKASSIVLFISMGIQANVVLRLLWKLGAHSTSPRNFSGNLSVQSDCKCKTKVIKCNVRMHRMKFNYNSEIILFGCSSVRFWEDVGEKSAGKGI